MNCKNCKTELLEHDDYCRNCGGKVIRNRLTLKNLFQHLSETFFNYDNKLLRTIIQLIRQPEDVIDSYVKGVRKKYINPISFFGLALTLSGLSIFFIKKLYLQHLDFSNLFEGVKASQKAFDSTSSTVLEYSSLFYSFLIPLFALISWITFYDKKYNFTEHIVTYLYTMSLMNIALVFVSQTILIFAPQNYLIFSMFTYPLMFLYHCFVFKRLFKLSFGNLILKSIIFFGFFFLVYVIVSIAIGIIMIATGTINLEDFKPPKIN